MISNEKLNERYVIEKNVDIFMECIDSVRLSTDINTRFVDHYVRFFHKERVCNHKDHLRKLLIKSEFYCRFFLDPEVYINDDSNVSFSFKDEDDKLYNFSYKITTHKNLYDQFEDIILGKFYKIKFYVYDNIEDENGFDEIIFIEN